MSNSDTDDEVSMDDDATCTVIVKVKGVNNDNTVEDAADNKDTDIDADDDADYVTDEVIVEDPTYEDVVADDVDDNIANDIPINVSSLDFEIADYIADEVAYDVPFIISSGKFEIKSEKISDDVLESMAPKVESIPCLNNDDTEELVVGSNNLFAAQDSLNETASDFNIFDDSATNPFAF